MLLLKKFTAAQSRVIDRINPQTARRHFPTESAALFNRAQQRPIQFWAAEGAQGHCKLWNRSRFNQQAGLGMAA